MENPMKILWKSYEHGWFMMIYGSMATPILGNHQWNAEPRLMRHERTQERLEISSGVGHNLRDPCETRTSGPGAVATRIEELELYVQDVQAAQQQIRRLPLYTQILRIQSSLATSISNGSWKLDLELPTTQNHPISD
jgi:hypothetical protein